MKHYADDGERRNRVLPPFKAFPPPIKSDTTVQGRGLSQIGTAQADALSRSGYELRLRDAMKAGG